MFTRLRDLEFKHRNVLRTALFFAVICGFVFYNAVLTTPQRKASAYGKTDLAVFYVAGSSVIGTIDLEPPELYERAPIKEAIKSVRPQLGGTWFLYPPQAALFFAPFGLAKLGIVNSVWLFLNCILFLVSFYLAINFLIGDRQLLRYRYSLIIMALTAAGPVNGLIQTGQINGVIWLLMLGGITLILLKHPYLAGTAFGIATSIKVFPILFFPYLLLKKKWKAAAAFFFSCVVFLVASLPVFGMDTYFRFIKKTFIPLAQGSIGTLYKSASLYGSFRKAIEQNVFSGIDISKKSLINNADPYFTALALVMLLIVSVLLWKRRNLHRGQDLLIDYSLIISFFLVFSKNVHSQYAFWILPIIIWAITQTWHRGSRRLIVLGSILLALTQYTRFLPEAVQFWWIIKPETLGLLGVFLFTAFACRKDFREKHIIGLLPPHDKA
ncbi:MAG: hypothetical protein COW24_03465 [Candidatus Kerfeldbacteria bacterium CG15_BIG_FIL_POST_REV_8_21_14_020_45_12]|uniref:DUF2029 domain-containing protein n=1 Tax=Candidatus Kerfeldbacteria bacterium CG15_BIG_FIL_POST_REV_8_21_14_020_45_12 TaxID=2014247 RepID=A0A2M7H3I7_9BACT|nr:MAG: hypothetical protein COW24_03465 [Candidatus Kerfeldbacteria bacterium CG15_BIG_FIL_POST_REV_8_21_14_020_45_12]PJA93077.1 MAG: hypothetical protein CO132_04990 [Candidatus Kerfeldbacteria bacterium CG_4_9_14_3_um_filter_45_8]